MKFSELMAFYDYKIINIVKKLKVSRETVKTWKEHNHIPFKSQCFIEVISHGELKANLDDFKSE